MLNKIIFPEAAHATIQLCTFAMFKHPKKIIEKHRTNSRFYNSLAHLLVIL